MTQEQKSKQKKKPLRRRRRQKLRKKNPKNLKEILQFWSPTEGVDLLDALEGVAASLYYLKADQQQLRARSQVQPVD